MAEPLTLLAITERQRDFLSSALHNAERNNVLLQQSLNAEREKRAAAELRIVELEEAQARIEPSKAAGLPPELRPPEHLVRTGPRPTMVPLSEDEDEDEDEDDGVAA